MCFVTLKIPMILENKNNVITIIKNILLIVWKITTELFAISKLIAEQILYNIRIKLLLAVYANTSPI